MLFVAVVGVASTVRRGTMQSTVATTTTTTTTKCALSALKEMQFLGCFSSVPTRHLSPSRIWNLGPRTSKLLNLELRRSSSLAPILSPGPSSFSSRPSATATCARWCVRRATRISEPGLRPTDRPTDRPTWAGPVSASQGAVQWAASQGRSDLGVSAGARARPRRLGCSALVPRLHPSSRGWARSVGWLVVTAMVAARGQRSERLRLQYCVRPGPRPRPRQSLRGAPIASVRARARVCSVAPAHPFVARLVTQRSSPSEVQGSNAPTQRPQSEGSSSSLPVSLSTITLDDRFCRPHARRSRTHARPITPWPFRRRLTFVPFRRNCAPRPAIATEKCHCYCQPTQTGDGRSD